MKNPTPEALNEPHLSKQIEELFEISNPENLKEVYLVGSFANPQKEIDRGSDYRSDVDIAFIVSDDSKSVPEYQPFITHGKVDIQFGDKLYSERAIDVLIGEKEILENLETETRIKLSVSLPSGEVFK